MTRIVKAAVLAAALSCSVAAPGWAQNYPFAPGNYTEVSMIDIADGGGMQYANYLAGEWRKAQEFAKSKGWITSYAVFNNVNSRPGEPDLYLSVTFPSFPNAAEDEKRDQAYRDFMKRTDTQMVAESGDRAKYRTVMGSFLLRELKFK
jgi:opacity protein-like surface antigen